MKISTSVCHLAHFLFVGAVTLLSLVPSVAVAAEDAAVDQLWQWEGGFDTLYTPGVYGKIGVPDPNNFPGVRDGALCWDTNDGKMWMMGGFGYDANGDLGYLCDVWSYNISTGNWTWEDGSYLCDEPGIYRDEVDEHGDPIPRPHFPGGHSNSMTWTDSNGILWFFGGKGVDEEGYWGDMNDIWAYNRSTFVWTFIDGYTYCGAKGIYGTKYKYDISNWPGARYNGVTWYVPEENEVWLFGGDGLDKNGNADVLNDLWCYNLNTGMWAWAHGSDSVRARGSVQELGKTAASNTPGARRSMTAWKSADGWLWVFGGEGYDCNGNFGSLNDLWCFDVYESLHWGCIGGSVTYDTTNGAPGNFGTKGVSAFENWPGGRSNGAGWISADKKSLWLFGGSGFGKEPKVKGWLNDVWNYDVTSGNWTWYNGDDGIDYSSYAGGSGEYGADFTPGGRGSVAFCKDNNGLMRIFGGYGVDARMRNVSLSDQWAFNPVSHKWAWIDGVLMQNPGGYYGNFGEASGGWPGSREFGANWVTPDGKMWMYGGYGFDGNGDSGILGDLWWFDPDTYDWIWVGGSDLISPAFSNRYPGGRFGQFCWSTPDGGLWLYGGYSHYIGGTAGFASDLWRMNSETCEWTLRKGTRGLNEAAVYGRKGKAEASNNPGGRMRGQSWVTADGRLWLFGGQLNEKNPRVDKGNDLWVFDPQTAMWTWVSGSSSANVGGVYGTKGVASSSSCPGARVDSCGWVDDEGNLWLYGGYGYDSTGSQSAQDGGVDLCDLWMYSPTSGNWTWVSGRNVGNVPTVKATAGVFTSTGMPGSRSGSTGWQALDGRFWVLGGYGADVEGNQGWLNDLWCYDSSKDKWAYWAGSLKKDSRGLYGEVGKAYVGDTPGGRGYAQGWVDGEGWLWLFGGEGYDRNLDFGMMNDMWSATPTPFDIELKVADFTKGVSSTIAPGAYVDFAWGVKSSELVTEPFWCELFASKTGGFDQVRFGGTITNSYRHTTGLAAKTQTILNPGTLRLNTVPDGVYTLIPSVNRQTSPGALKEIYNYLNNWAPLPYKRIHVRNPKTGVCDLQISGDVNFAVKATDNTWVDVTGTVKNVGPGASGKFWVEVFYGTLTAEGTLMPQGTIGGGYVVMNLASGGTQEFTLSGRVPAGVDKRALACIVDSTDVVPETNETNNCQMLYKPAILPPGKKSGVDLVVKSLSIDSKSLAPNQVQPGQTLTWTVSVLNQGTKDCGKIWLELFGSQTGGIDFIRSGITLTKSEVVDGPAVGEQKTYVVKKVINSVGDGMYTPVVVVNRTAVSANPGDERPLDNRLAYATGRLSLITPDSGKVNLVWKERPTVTRSESKVIVTGRVKNAGTTACNSFWTEVWTGSFQKKTGFFYRNTAIAGGQNVTSLAAGAEVAIHIESQGAIPDGQLLGIITDVTDLVPETDETDNYYYDYAPSSDKEM
ncbi:hypothetical protein GX645_06880 [Candidatus Sumerlaeota bacterium]|nr:hypothetical protein [Candidatus Sumerlaeota bacterium]